MLNYFLLLFLIAYMIFRFSKPPPSIDDYKKKKEPDVYNIEKIYMISSICFVICTIFIILRPFTIIVIAPYFIAFPTVFFGIFNTVMTVLFIKYRDDIYFFESYNLIFTLLVTFIGMYSIYNPLDKQLFQMMSCPTDIPQETNHNRTFEAYFLSPSKHTATDGYVSTRGRDYEHEFAQQTHEQLNPHNETLHKQYNEFKTPQLTRKNIFNPLRKNKVQDIPRHQPKPLIKGTEMDSIREYNAAQNPVSHKAYTVRGQEFDELRNSGLSQRYSRMPQGFTETQHDLSFNSLNQENSS